MHSHILPHSFQKRVFVVRWIDDDVAADSAPKRGRARINGFVERAAHLKIAERHVAKQQRLESKLRHREQECADARDPD